MEPIDPNTRKWLSWAIIVVLIVISTITGVVLPIPQPPIESLGYTHFSGLVVTAPTTVATATPGAVINSYGLGNILEIQDAATPVVQVSAAGNLTLSRLVHLPCSYVEETANTNETLTLSSSCYVVAVDTSVNADYTLATTGAVTGTMAYIHQIGAGTLVITDTNLLTADGNALSLAANESVALMFTGTKWAHLATSDNQ